MPAPTLTPSETNTDYALTVSQVDLNDAAAQIHAITCYTLAEHVDVREIDEGNVRRAWAIVASRLRADTAGDHARNVSTETEGNYSYNESITIKSASQLSVMAGKPNELLRIGTEWASFSEHGHKRAEAGRRGIPPFIDAYGTAFY